MRDPVRILTTANHLDSAGGLERTHLTNARDLAARGHRVDLAYVDGGAFEDSWRAITATMTQVPTTLPRRAHPVGSTWAVATAVRHARRLEPDVVYAYRYWDLPFAVAVARRRPTAVVYHLCLPPPRELPRWLRAVLGRVDVTLSVSAHTLELWRATGLRTDRAQVVLTSVDLDTYMPAPPAARAATRREHGIDPHARVVFFGGRLAPEKGVDVLVRAFRQVAHRIEGSHLVVLGSPGLAVSPSEGKRFVDELHTLAAGLPVTFVPQKADVVPLLAAADVATVPSVWPEPLSRSIMEALACGVPVVATAVGGSPEVLSGSLSDLLVAPGDPDPLAERLLALLEWRVNDPGLGTRCREAAEGRLSLAQEVDLIERAMFDAASARQY